jgi:hypothetical protein
MLLQKLAGHDHALDLVGALVDLGDGRAAGSFRSGARNEGAADGAAPEAEQACGGRLGMTATAAGQPGQSYNGLIQRRSRLSLGTLGVGR